MTAVPGRGGRRNLEAIYKSQRRPRSSRIAKGQATNQPSTGSLLVLSHLPRARSFSPPFSSFVSLLSAPLCDLKIFLDESLVVRALIDRTRNDAANERRANVQFVIRITELGRQTGINFGDPRFWRQLTVNLILNLIYRYEPAYTSAKLKRQGFNEKKKEERKEKEEEEISRLYQLPRACHLVER